MSYLKLGAAVGDTAAVKASQAFLTARGFPCTADGVAGSQTFSAQMQYARYVQQKCQVSGSGPLYDYVTGPGASRLDDSVQDVTGFQNGLRTAMSSASQANSGYADAYYFLQYDVITGSPSSGGGGASVDDAGGGTDISLPAVAGGSTGTYLALGAAVLGGLGLLWYLKKRKQKKAKVA